MSRTVGVVKASQPHFILKLIRCYLLFHNAFERTNKDNCRAFDWKHLASWKLCFFFKTNSWNIRLSPNPVGSTQKISLPLRSDSTASFCSISKQILNRSQAHPSRRRPFMRCHYRQNSALPIFVNGAFIFVNGAFRFCKWCLSFLYMVPLFL